MSNYRFQRAAIESADTPWRSIDRALARWVLAHGGDSVLAATAAWASYVESLGDTALMLRANSTTAAGPLALDGAEVEQLRASKLVGDGSARTAFVIDAEARFFLWRNYALEGAIATQVRARLRIAASVAESALAADMDQLFGGENSQRVQAQRAAVAAVIGKRLFLLTGGPGTGKTSTVLKMLLMLQVRQSVPLSIALAAPTGKAAQRLLQSLRQGKQQLNNRLPAHWRPALDAIPDHAALTLHRLLGFSPQRNTYARHRDDPIAADVVVVDEASMVDLAMLQALLDALRPEACLILVGDADQLTSVAAGSVLQDLVHVLERTHPQHVMRLRHSFRAAQHLVAINDAVRVGDCAALHAAIGAAGTAARQLQTRDRLALATQASRWADNLAMLDLRRIPSAGAQPTAGISAREQWSSERALQALTSLASQQVLCALRDGDSGAIATNQRIEQRLRAQWQVPVDSHWYAGRAVMITRNDYAAALFNGDIGLALEDVDGGLQIWFETVDDQGRASARACAPAMLPEHEGAFAITIHKSQGSEYDRVAVVLPAIAEHRILSRQLLYTALSRAKREIEIWGSDAVVQAALAQVAKRHGGLAARLASQ